MNCLSALASEQFSHVQPKAKPKSPLLPNPAKSGGLPDSRAEPCFAALKNAAMFGTLLPTCISSARSVMSRRKFCQLIAATALEGVPPRNGAQSATSSILAPRFSCEIGILKLPSFDRCIEVVAEAGYQGVELGGYFQEWTPGEQHRLMAKMHSLGVMIDMLSGLKASFAIPGQTDDFVSHVTEHCHIAKGLECPQINIKSGPRWGDPNIEQYLRSRAEGNCKRSALRLAALPDAAGYELQRA
jgi:hypothetical protein